jgi:polyisoprenoid-binding protein YceI
MNKLLILVLAFAALASVSCEDPAANKPRAVTAPVPEGTTAEAPANVTAPSTATFLPVTPENSKIEFTGSKVTGKHDGGFRAFSGKIELIGDRPEDSRVSVEIDMNSIYTDTDGLTDHLKTSDFFDVEKYPKASFVSTRITPDAAKGAGNYTVTGNLEMRGVKREVSFPAAISVNDKAVEVKTEFAINRKDFQILYAGKADDLIRDDVVIRLDLNASR